MNRFTFYEKPYGRGYAAPSTGDINPQRAILEMEEMLSPDPDLGASYLPERITLRMHLIFIHYENEATLERGMNGKIYPKTFLYQPGHVKGDGSAALKPHSKIRYVDFIYEGRGFYLNLQEQAVPFYEDSWVVRKIQASPETRLFRKPFAVRETPVRVMSTFHRSAAGDYTEVEGCGRNLYPRYPYGGYCGPRTTLDQMEPVYCTAEVQGETTVLALEKSSCGAGNGVFPQRTTDVEQITVGEAVVRGFITFEFFHEGEGHLYRSCHFEHPGGMRDLVQVHFEPD